MPADTTNHRIAPIEPPYDPDVARTLERMMPPGMEPLKLFRTVAHNPHILDKLRSTGAYLLNFGTLQPADRELVIHRTCARCGCEYEWGVHAAMFARQVGLTDEQLRATVTGSAGDPAFSREQGQLIAFVDALHDQADVPETLWRELADRYSDAQLVELVALVGQYHGVSFTANALGIELEESAERFPTA